MHIWGIDGSDVGLDNLNSSISPWDAVVDARTATTRGRIFPNVTDALNAGHRSIIVRSGSYPGFTVPAGEHVNIEGDRRPIISSGVIEDGARFTSQITIDSFGNRLCRLGAVMTGAQSYGLRVTDGRHQIIEQCSVAGVNGASTTNFKMTGPMWHSVVRDCYFNSGGNGILISATGASDTIRGIKLEGNNISGCAGNGIGLLDFGDADNSHHRDVTLFDNLITSCAKYWGHGVFVDQFSGAKILANTVMYSGSSDNNNDAHGIYVAAPPSTPLARSSLSLNRVMYSQGYGIAISEASTRVAVGGNISVNNYGGNYAHCSHCPGYDDGTYGSNVGA